MRVAAWQIEPSGPVRTAPSQLALERLLEDWIEQDPALVAEGLRVVRQLMAEAGRIDLLAIDSAGRWVVIEIKAGNTCAQVRTAGVVCAGRCFPCSCHVFGCVSGGGGIRTLERACARCRF